MFYDIPQSVGVVSSSIPEVVCENWKLKGKSIC